MNTDFMQKNKYYFFTVGAIGTFMATLDGSILNVALPTISTDFSCSIDQIAWVAVSYSLTLISLLLVFGGWVDKKGYLFAYRFGYLFFIVGSILCILSDSLSFLIIARIIQAIGTAMFAAIGPGMVTTVFGEKERGKGIGMMVMMVAAGFMIGPPLGGLLLNYFDWTSIFMINIPIGFVGLYMTNRFFKVLPKPKSDRKLKLQSAVSMSLALVSLTFCLTLLNDYPISDFRIYGLAVFSAISLGLFIKFESDPKTALIGLHIFKNRQFTSSVGAMLFMFAALSGVLLMVPFYLEKIKLYEPNQVGLFLIIFPIMMFIFAPLSGRLSDKIGFRVLTVFGLLVLISGFYMLTFLTAETTQTYLIINFVLLGFGVGVFNTPNSSALMGSVSDEFRGVTSSILGMTRNIGMSMGVALSTTMFAFFQMENSSIGETSAQFVKSYSEVIYISIGITIVSLLFSLIRGQKPVEKVDK